MAQRLGLDKALRCLAPSSCAGSPGQGGRGVRIPPHRRNWLRPTGGPRLRVVTALVWLGCFLTASPVYGQEAPAARPVETVAQRDRLTIEHPSGIRIDLSFPARGVKEEEITAVLRQVEQQLRVRA